MSVLVNSAIQTMQTAGEEECLLRDVIQFRISNRGRYAFPDVLLQLDGGLNALDEAQLRFSLRSVLSLHILSAHVLTIIGEGQNVV